MSFFKIWNLFVTCFVNSENFYCHENVPILLVFGFLSTLITLETQGVDALRLMALNVGNENIGRDNDFFFDKHDDEHIKCKAQSKHFNIQCQVFVFLVCIVYTVKKAKTIKS
jgi:hypothetical protein